MPQKWTVEFIVADSWVVDGFEIDDDRALDMIESQLPFAYNSELSAKVIKSPETSIIEGLQSGSIEPIR